jgi:hypothetical protein
VETYFSNQILLLVRIMEGEGDSFPSQETAPLASGAFLSSKWSHRGIN